MSLSTCVLLRSWAIRRLVLSFHGRGWGSRGRSQCTEEFGLGISELRKCCWGAMPVVVFWSVTRCFRWFWIDGFGNSIKTVKTPLRHSKVYGFNGQWFLFSCWVFSDAPGCRISRLVPKRNKLWRLARWAPVEQTEVMSMSKRSYWPFAAARYSGNYRSVMLWGDWQQADRRWEFAACSTNQDTWEQGWNLGTARCGASQFQSFAHLLK